MDEDEMVLVIRIQPQLLELVFVELLDVQGKHTPQNKERDDEFKH